MSDNFLIKLSELAKELIITCPQEKLKLENLMAQYDSSLAPPQEAIEVLMSMQVDKTIADLQYSSSEKAGVIPITGLLLDKYDPFLDWYIGITAYETVVNDLKLMLEAGAETIIFEVNSGGGQAFNMMSTASYIRELADQYNANLITYNDGVMASAAYGLGVIADEVIAHPDAETGSVGVVVSLTDYSKMYEKYGIKKLWITAGEGKVPYNEDGSFSQSFLDDVQAKVNALYEKFTSHVSQYRPTSQADIKDLGAKTYSTDLAIENKLVDSSMTREEFRNYIHNLLTEKNKPMSLFDTKGIKMSNEDKEAFMAEVKESLSAEFAKELATKLADAKAEWEQDKQKEVAAKEQEITDLKAQLESVATAQQAAKDKKRLETLCEAIGDEKGKAEFEALKDLSDELFAKFVDAYKGQIEAKAESHAQLSDEGQPVVTEANSFEAKKKEEKERLQKKFANQNK